jgi:hypothetical protein
MSSGFMADDYVCWLKGGLAQLKCLQLRFMFPQNKITGNETNLSHLRNPFLAAIAQDSKGTLGFVGETRCLKFS